MNVLTKTAKYRNELEESAQTLQKLYVSINDYLASMYSEGVLTEEQASQSAGVLYVLCDIDRIGILLNEIVNTISVENKSKHKYSKDALKELRKAMAQIHEIYTASIRAISGDGSMDIEALQKQKDEVMALDERLRKTISPVSERANVIQSLQLSTTRCFTI